MYHYQESYKMLVWLCKQANFDQLEWLVVSHNWNPLYEGSINEAIEKFTYTLLSFVKRVS